MSQPISSVQKEIWADKPPANSGLQRHLYMNEIVDALSRPSSNRVTATTNATAIACNGAVQSTGIGTGQILPSRFAEIWVKARATFNLSSNGTLYIYVYRTLGAIPANGAAPNGGDVAVAGDSFAGPATVGGQNMNGSLSFIDTGLDQTKKYSYYFAVKGTNALTANLVNASQIMASEF
jgi:hypothetical protein